ncbi:hypothetical protein P7K49_013178, partial [Saguinus oedipus]
GLAPFHSRLATFSGHTLPSAGVGPYDTLVALLFPVAPLSWGSRLVLPDQEEDALG